jgi:Malectin domain
VPLYRINAGGPPFTDSNDNAWVDQFFNTGTTLSTTNSIDLTAAQADETLYKTCRLDPVGGPSMRYRPVAVTGKQYLIKLHFAELQKDAAGQRKFQLRLDGVVKLNNFDVFAEAGGRDKAITRSFEVTSIRTYINIRFLQQVGEPMVSAIEVFEK